MVGCPACEREGIECTGPSRVSAITVRHLVRSEHHADLPEGTFYFCPQRQCETVYFDEAGHEIRKEQMTAKVWRKETEMDAPICYCFGFSARDIVKDARSCEVPRIPVEIRDKIQAGLCACEIKNPRGTCCLGDVAYWVKQA